MGQVTPNIGIYTPAAGETNYDASFAAGMQNIDQHDHSGGPNKGVPIGTSGVADGSITYPKLNANVADNTTGIGTNTGPLANQLIILGLLKNIFQLVATSGFISKDGSLAHARTLQPTANQTTMTNGDGVAGDPVFGLASTIYTNISFDSGAHTLNSYTSATFTPVLAFGGASVGITYATQAGKYWKIGAVVYFNINIFLTSKGSSVGNATITGLPFASANDGQVQMIGIEAFLNTYPAGTTYIVGELDPNTSAVIIAACGAGNQVAVTNTEFANNSELTISGFYWVA